MKEQLKRIFLVHKCVGCRKILDYDNFNEAFCPSCREIYLASKMSICPECSSEADKCLCMPAFLKKDAVPSLRKLFFYSKERSGEPQNRLIYYLKKNKSKRVSRAIAREISVQISAELARLEIEEKPLLVGVPRSRSAFFEYGFDQTELICHSVSKLSNVEYCNLLKRRRGSKAQKSLTAGERRKNIKDSVYLDNKTVSSIKGRTVILFDDVVTTGASMSACAQILKSAGAKNILCVAIASDIKT